LTAGTGTWTDDEYDNTLRFYEEAGVKKNDLNGYPSSDTLPNDPAFDSLTPSNANKAGLTVYRPTSTVATSIVFLSATQMRLYGPGIYSTLSHLPEGYYTRQEE